MFTLIVPPSGRAAAAELFTRQLPPRLARATDLSGQATVAWLLGGHGFQVLAKSGVGAAGGGGAGGVGRRGAEPGVGGAGPGVGAVRGAGGGPHAGGASRWSRGWWARARRPARRATCTRARLLSGWPALGVEIDERTLPQEVRYDEIGGVSYTKGCYTGQETVARLHFRGHTNRELRGLRWTRPSRSTAARSVHGEKDVGSVRSTLALEDRDARPRPAAPRGGPGRDGGGRRPPARPWWRCRSARTRWMGDEHNGPRADARGPSATARSAALLGRGIPGHRGVGRRHRAVMRHPPMPVSAAAGAMAAVSAAASFGLLLTTAHQHEHRGQHHGLLHRSSRYARVWHCALSQVTIAGYRCRRVRRLT